MFEKHFFLTILIYDFDKERLKLAVMLISTKKSFINASEEHETIIPLIFCNLAQVVEPEQTEENNRDVRAEKN